MIDHFFVQINFTAILALSRQTKVLVQYIHQSLLVPLRRDGRSHTISQKVRSPRTDEPKRRCSE
jgi:hypothetical protein